MANTNDVTPVHPLKYGLIGCGRFGIFCLEQLQDWERIQPVAATDIITSLAEAVAERFDLAAYATREELLAHPELDLVLISTPPNTHYQLALQALQAGKHVICEKPLALTVDQADELIATAAATGRLLAVNHMLRYSQIAEAVHFIVQSKVLGEPLHFFFENYAEDERLPLDHWFWDPRTSGGIFIEHAVHFFDLYRWWIGPGVVTAAHEEPRPGTGQIDRVWCAERHQNGVLGQQYHGFDQPVRLDRAEHRIVFERGDLTMVGWIPVELRLNGIVDDAQQSRLATLCRSCGLQVVEHYEDTQQLCKGRGNQYHVTAKVKLDWELTEDRGLIYGNMIRALLVDQLLVLDDPTHTPRLTAHDAREAVAMAVEATKLAQSVEVSYGATS